MNNKWGFDMKNSTVNKLKLRNEANKSVKVVEKRIRYLQRELVRATFKGPQKEGLCRKLLRLIKQERLKIQQMQQSVH